MGERISVIVPAYNIEAYLETCLNSLRNQTYPDTEIIVVDDGSTDKTPAICDAFAQADSRIRVIHQANAGQCAARNAALDVCTGKYLMFVDGDDYVREDMLSQMMQTMIRDDLDFIRCPYLSVDERETGALLCDEDSGNVQVFDCRGVVENFLTAPFSRKKCFTASVWAALYKTELFEDVRFPEGFIYEEGFVLPDVYLKSRRAGFMDCSMYYYRKNPDGTMAKNKLTTEKGLKSLGDWKHIHYCFKDRFPEFNANTCGRWVSKYLLALDELYHTADADRDGYYKKAIAEELISNRDYFAEMKAPPQAIREIDALKTSAEKWQKVRHPRPSAVKTAVKSVIRMIQSARK